MKQVFLLSMLLSGLGLQACSFWECDATSCPGGCCDATGTCLLNGGETSCGIGGAQCRSCLSTQMCTNGQCGCAPGLTFEGGACRCTVASCNGCCASAPERCIAVSNQNRTSCGTGGRVCATCVDACQQGQCCLTTGELCSTTSGSTSCCSTLRCAFSSGGNRCQ